ATQKKSARQLGDPKAPKPADAPAKRAKPGGGRGYSNSVQSASAAVTWLTSTMDSSWFVGSITKTSPVPPPRAPRPAPATRKASAAACVGNGTENRTAPVAGARTWSAVCAPPPGSAATAPLLRK